MSKPLKIILLVASGIVVLLVFVWVVLLLLVNTGAYKPQLETAASLELPSVLKSLAGPVQKLFKMGKDLFPGGECKVFYTGSVAPPK